ncbi:MAG: glycosyltransferase [Candidatus Marinimicrobia bacterium]|nr:glycosyltransferase [Candidatus Neomarinimicrobiota bacterium]
MTLIGLLAISIYFLYAIFILYFLTGLVRLKKSPVVKYSKQPTVSVVVAARNEEENIRDLLVDLSNQSYPREKFQIIIADDRSTDKTWSIISDYINKYSNFYGVKVSNLSKTMTPKKYALTKTIEKSNGEIIISTDADCRVPNTWVESIVESFDKETGVVVGYSKIDTESDRFFDHYQSIDFLALMSANAGTLGWGNAWTGSGQNIAYRHSVFDKIKGFKPVSKRVSGDDFYLIQAISKIAKARYNTNPNGFVKTKPSENVRQFISQRIRWASNTRNLFNTDLFFLLFLFVNLFINTILLSALVVTNYWQFLPMLFGIKFLFDTFVIFYGSKIFKTKIEINAYLIWFFLQPIYIPLLGILSILGKFRWKV